MRKQQWSYILDESASLRYYGF